MKRYNQLVLTGFALLLAFALPSCKKQEETLSAKYAIRIHFIHSFGGDSLQMDTLRYVNLSGNHIKVADLQYFISGVTLVYSDGTRYKILSDADIHYTDLRLPATLNWFPADEVPYNTPDSLLFTFGLSAQDNISNRFPNPPERDMFWPEILGGGYHYMKLNLLWKDDTMPEAMPYNFHLGIGQTYSTPEPDPDSITGYVQNFFGVRLKVHRYGIIEGESHNLYLTMHVDKWFDGPATINLATAPLMMQNQQAMHDACLNGKEAFTVATSAKY